MISGNVCVINVIQNDRTLNLSKKTKERQKWKRRSKPSYKGHRKYRCSNDSSHEYNFFALLLSHYYCYHVYCLIMIHVWRNHRRYIITKIYSFKQIFVDTFNLYSLHFLNTEVIRNMRL